ncbi:hypothetical protein L6452_32521 [Arctium lappa]|uniref:Uncharacterized protein n=1 Tax=Arctium lappa TaxID=4217 RepID=A0ACB8Z3Y4_ARCLA|nr:hypothetical protein L6452_32521 [Arctium lappa]
MRPISAELITYTDQRRENVKERSSSGATLADSASADDIYLEDDSAFDDDDLFLDDPEDVISASSESETEVNLEDTSDVDDDQGDNHDESHDVELYRIPRHVGPRPSVTP